MPPGLEIVGAAAARRSARRADRERRRGRGARSPSCRRARASARRACAAARSCSPRGRDLEVVELRGNVPTRVKKVDEGHVHAAILAAAGLHRLGVSAAHHRVSRRAGVAARRGAGRDRHPDSRRRRCDARDARAPLARCATRRATCSAERAFLAALEGGCQVPIGALAMRVGHGSRVLHGFISDVKGARVVRGEIALDRRAAGAERRASGERAATSRRERHSRGLAARRSICRRRSRNSTDGQ